MPNVNKRGDWHRSYYEHDNRDYNSGGGNNSQRHVSFKGSNGGRHGNRKRNNREWSKKFRDVLSNEDVEMNGLDRGISRNSPYSVPQRGGGGHFQRRGGPRRSPVPYIKRNIPESACSWYKIIARNCAIYEKEYVIGLFLDFVKPQTFIPFGLRKVNNDYTFYVDDHQVAMQLFDSDRKIKTSDGQRMRVHARTNMPFIVIDEAMTEKIKLAMSKRYQPESKALNLSKFYADSSFIEEALFIPINRPTVLAEILKIIVDVIPDLRALDLSSNMLNVIEPIKMYSSKLPCLTVLHLANNRFRQMEAFDCLQGLPIEDFNIDGNPLCDKFKEQSAYVRDVRKRLGKVIKLDGCDLPPPILFDVEDNVSLIPSKPGYFCNMNGGEIIQKFLEQYYTIFDSDSRSPLVDAYHENAHFSLTCMPSGLGQYSSHSRNILNVTNLDKRTNLLKTGRAEIMSCLTTLNKTQHDPLSLAVDLPLLTDQLIHVSVAGVYKEVDSNKKPIRSFSRVFLLVPFGTGLCIIHDMLTITIASGDQIRAAFKVPAVPTQPSTVTSPHGGAVPNTMMNSPHGIPNTIVNSPHGAVPIANGIVTSPQTAVSTTNQEIEAKKNMVIALAAQSGMNLSWSEKCLNETQWNFQQALHVFNEFNKEGKIPAEAFMK